MGLAVVLVVLYMTGIALVAQVPKGIANQDECAIDQPQGLGCAHGTVLDENDGAVKGIKVELVPTFKTGDEQWNATRRVWTDEMGRYTFNEIEAGEYLLAIHRDDAPDAKYPFATSYYPGVEDERDAGHVSIGASSQAVLSPLRLKRLDVATIDVNVVWPDGTRPKRSNLLFHNASYPQQAVIGDVAPQVDEGRGQFTLPKGFEYGAQAKVDCDGGKIIESRESAPVQVRVADGFTPADLTFVVPGPPCKLWAP